MASAPILSGEVQRIKISVWTRGVALRTKPQLPVVWTDVICWLQCDSVLLIKVRDRVCVAKALMSN